MSACVFNDGEAALQNLLRRDGFEQGGLSGLPVREKSNQVLKTLAEHIDGKLPIIGVGGIMNGKDAAEKIRLGATAVQVYSGMIYKGPALVKECLAALK